MGGGACMAACGTTGGVIISGTFFPHRVQNFIPGMSGCPHCVQNAISLIFFTFTKVDLFHFKGETEADDIEACLLILSAAG